MTKRLLALFLTLVMVLQPVLPAAADMAGEGPAALTAEATETSEEATEAAEETTEASVETTEATEETTEATEETTEATEETTEATEETTEATEETTEPTEATEETTEPTEATEETTEPTEATGETTEPTEETTEPTEAAEETTDPAEEAGVLQGKGTEEEPYVLSSAQDLEALALLVNGGEEGYAEAHYVLGADLELGAHTPIGTEAHPFRGSFDGSGHRITGLTGGKGKYWGLFGVAQGAKLMGIALEEVTVSGDEDMTAGAVAGLLRDSTLARSYAAGKMNADGKRCLLGGLVGRAEQAVISDSFVQMTIQGYACAGGLAAQAADTRFDSCYAIGRITCSDGGDFEALAGKTEGDVAFDGCYQVSLPGQHGQFLTLEEACEDLFGGLDPEIWEMGPEGYPFPVLAACPYTGSGYRLPDMEEHGTGFIPAGEPENVPRSYTFLRQNGVFPSKFQTPNLPDVRDQGVFGTCWAHSTIAGAEVSLIKQGLLPRDINLSEAQLAWFHHKGTKNSSGEYEDPLNNFNGDHNVYTDKYNPSVGAYTTFDGDNYQLSSYSLASGIGLMEEDGLTQYTTGNLQSIDQDGLPYEYAFSKDAALLQDVRQLPLDGNINVVKQAILDYGSVGVNYYHHTSLYTNESQYYYCSENYTPDHAVLIVGWDDTISRSNFRDNINHTMPSRDGAWIVRNSWGDRWGSNGYFYMSYDTCYVASASEAGYAWKYGLATDDMGLYQYDGSESLGSYSFTSNTGTFQYANVFTAQGNDVLNAVSFWMSEMADVDYRIDVYLNPASNDPTSGTPAASVSGKTSLAGYYTVDLRSPVRLSKGTRFSLVMTLTGRTLFHVSYDMNSRWDWTEAVSCAKPGQSYYTNGGKWRDAYGSLLTGNFRIKGLVTRQPEAALPFNTITAENLTLTQNLTDDQTVALNASALGGAKLSYRSNNTSVTVSSNGIVTVSKEFQGTASITIVAEATSQYRLTTKTIMVTVKEAPYNTITASDITLTVDRAQRQTVALNASALDGAELYYHSHSSDVTVSSSGIVTIPKGFIGYEYITIIAGATSRYRQTEKTIRVTVEEAPYNTITASDITLTQNLANDQTVALNASALENAKLSYYSYSSDVTVSSSGIVTIPKGFAGSAYITITAADTAHYQQAQKTITITVEYAPYNTITASDITLTQDPTKDQTVALNASALENAKLSYYIFNPLVSVNDSGIVTIGKRFTGSVGITITAEATAHYRESTLVITVTVEEAPENTITASDITLTANVTEAQTVALNASAKGGAKLSYESSTPDVSVDSSGTVTVAKGFAGQAAITITAAATSQYQEATKTVTVTVRGLASIQVGSGTDLKVQPGHDIAVPVVLTRNTGFAQLSLTASYDQKVLKLNSITRGQSISGGSFSTSGSTVTWNGGNLAENAGTGELVILNFTAKEAAATGATAVAVTANMADRTGTALQLDCISGSIQIVPQVFITYDANGGTGAPKPTEKTIGQTVYLSSTQPTRTGYRFAGWAESPDAVTSTYPSGGIYTKEDSITLYAVWMSNVYSICFYANDGTQKSLNQDNLNYDSTYSLRDCGFTRTGYTFLGWAESEAGPVVYGGQAQVKNLTAQNNVTVPLYAQWAVSHYQVRFDSNGGENTPEDLQIAYEESFRLPEANRRNYRLTGWTAVVGGETRTYQPGEEVKNLTAEDGAVILFQAQWVWDGRFGSLSWNIVDDETLVIGGSGEMPSGDYPWVDLASQIRRLEVASGVTSIGQMAFSGFDMLEEVILSDTVVSVGRYAFKGCGSLETFAVSDKNGAYTTADGVLFSKNGEVLVCYPAGKTGSYQVPQGVKTIGTGAFYGAQPESVTLEEGITTLEEEAFLACGLTEIKIPNSVISIGNYALGYDANHTKIEGFTITAMTNGEAARAYAEGNGFVFNEIRVVLQLELPDSMTAGAAILLEAQVLPAEHDTGSYVWSLKNPADAVYMTLRGNRLTAAKTVPERMDVTVVCENGELRAEKTISVVPALTGITICRNGEPVSSLTVDVNDDPTVILTVKAVPEGAQLDPGWSWSDSKGVLGGYYPQADGTLQAELLTNAKLGTVTLTVKDAATKKTGSVKLTTTRKSTEKIIVSGASDTLTGGSTLQLKAQLAGSPANTKVLWSLAAEDQTYASINASGKLTAAQVTEKHTVTVLAAAADGGSTGEYRVNLVPKVQGIGLTLNGKAAEKTETVYLNDTNGLTLKAIAWPQSAVQDVDWTVPKNKLVTATTGEDGTLALTLTGETGTVTLKATATDGSKKTASVQLKICRRPDHVEILDSKGKQLEGPITLKGKQSYSFKTNVWAENNAKLTDKTLVWSVDPADEAYVTVNNSGKVTVKSFAGSPVEVTVEARVQANPEIKDSVTLELQPDVTAGVYINETDGRQKLNGMTYTADLSKGTIALNAQLVGLPEGTSVVWGPTNQKGVAVVDQNGTVRLNKAGTVTVTATAGKYKASFKLVITDTVKTLTIENAPKTLAGGQKVTLKAAMSPAKPTNGKLTWFLMDNGGGAATITPAGVLTAAKVTGVFEAKAAVKTQDGSLVSEPVTIRIVPGATLVVITGAPQGGTVDLNTCKGLKLASTVYPTTASQEVEWTSSNKQVQVDGKGNVTILSGAKPGAVTITATAKDGSRKKTTVKLNLTRYVTSISMVETAEVVSGKTLTLKATPDKDATNKKLVWTMTGDTAYCTLSNGSLRTKAVTQPKTVTVRATAADGSGIYAECRVTVLPK